MINKQCERCKKTFSQKGYLKHLDNKNICEKKNIDVDYKIRNFGEEDTSYITFDDFQKIYSDPSLDCNCKGKDLKKCICAGAQKRTIMKLIYMNPEHPENQTIYIDNRKNTWGMRVYKNGKWLKAHKKQTIMRMDIYTDNFIRKKELELATELERKTGLPYINKVLEKHKKPPIYSDELIDDWLIE